MPEPRLTIVIPTFNRPDMLPRALKGCLAQTVPVKILIADDGDPEATLDLIEQQFPAAWDKGIITHLYTKTDEAWVNWRAGAQAATTEFIAWHQDDDVVRKTYAQRICEAFDRHPKARLWMAQLKVGPDERMCLWNCGNGPWVPMDFMEGKPFSFAEGSVIASSSYFTSWSLCPAMAFRDSPEFRAALVKMPPRCDIFVERLIPAMVANGGSFIADPVVAGTWIVHDSQLSTKQHPDQPRQTGVMIKALDDLMDGMEGWEESLAQWCRLNASQSIVAWIGEIDRTIKEGGQSRYARKVQQILVESLIGRVKWGYTSRWWHKASRWIKDKAAVLG